MTRFRRFVLAASLVLPASIAAAQSRELEGGWVLETGNDPSSYGLVVSVSKQSEGTIEDEYATRDVSPRLAFVCTPGNEAISAQIDWQRFISSFNTEVGFRVDDGSTIWQKWGVDQSNKVTTSKSEADSRALIDVLAGGSELAAEVAPYSGSPITVQFDLTGYSRALDALHEACR